MVSKSKHTDNSPWYLDLTIYQVYLRSIGTYNDLTENISYYVDLGVECLWINPTFPHGGKDGGYDITDYYGISNEFGTMDDFKKFIETAHSVGLRVILDLVCNHTSNLHPWFLDSVSKEITDKDDWYCWYNEKEVKDLNWVSEFVDTPFTYSKERDRYYYHFFYPEQPDLNFNCKAVMMEFYKVMSFWLDMGVDGFRLDAVSHLVEGVGRNEGEMNDKQINSEDNFRVWEEVRRWIDDKYGGDRILLAETNREYTQPEQIERYSKIFHLVMDFNFLETIDRLFEENKSITNITPEILRSYLPQTKNAVYFLNNHDMMRNRYGDKEETLIHLAKLLLGCVGCKIIYYGDEIGMKNLETDKPYPESREAARGKFEFGGTSNEIFGYYKKLLETKCK